MTYRVRNIVVAVALAALAALLVTFYVANYKKTVQQGEKNVTVYVATKKIEAGMSGGEALRSQSLHPQKVTRRSVVPGAISNPAQIEDLVATETVYAGEQVTVSRFRPVQERGIRAQLTGNQRAFQLAGDANQLLVGTLRPGDRIDLVAGFGESEGKDATEAGELTRLVLRDILVLAAAEAEAAASKLGANQGASVQLALTDAQVRKLKFTLLYADGWHFALRPVLEPSDSGEALEFRHTMICDGMPIGKYGFCRGGV
jgi:Flp pilus assembly protein CpaB